MRRFPVLLLLIVSISAALAQTQAERARAELNLGVHAYKQANYETAIQHFKNAVALDPTLLSGKLYLATANAVQVVPGVDSDENRRFAQNSIALFKNVAEDPNATSEQRLASLKGVASLYFNIRDLDTAKAYQERVIELDPNDPEAYYTIGVIDWTQTYKPRMEARTKFGLKPTEPLTDPIVCSEVRAANQDKVKEGMDVLTKALQLRPDYDDAMAYMNLMYRERADIQCDDPAARTADLQKADEWVNLTLATKQRKATQQRTAGTPPPPPPPPPKP